METLNVVFRKELSGDVLAVFPSIPADYHGAMLCYAHVGQHGSCSNGYYYRETKPATLEEYGPLLDELRRIYETGADAVRLIPRKKRSINDVNAFCAETRRLANA
jgi:hypothetical protein